ncbi:MAG: copper homeostasis protein CutC [Saprospiraceae bacterium]
MKIEVCAANIQSALTAQRAGAHRIELCSALDGGGLTPSAGLIYAAVQHLQIPVNVLIRPREGNFTYTRDELQIMLDDIAFCHDAQVAGVVIGALDAQGHFDLHAMEAMVASAEGLDITCHRAFDYVRDPFAALEALIDLGIRRVLTSGQQTTAYEGRFLIQKLVEKADGRIEIMPGAGITPKNIGEIAETTGAREFHMTGRKKTVQPTAHEIPGLEWCFWESDEEIIREVLNYER